MPTENTTERVQQPIMKVHLRHDGTYRGPCTVCGRRPETLTASAETDVMVEGTIIRVCEECLKNEIDDCLRENAAKFESWAHSLRTNLIVPSPMPSYEAWRAHYEACSAPSNNPEVFRQPPCNRKTFETELKAASRATQLENSAGLLRSLIGRLEVPSYAAWRAFNDDVAAEYVSATHGIDKTAALRRVRGNRAGLEAEMRVAADGGPLDSDDIPL